jgi:phosphate transport system ATP-binding protein
LALDPELLLLDEPTSALDPKATAMVEEAIMSLQGRAVVIVSHDAAQLERLCSTIIHLSCKESDKAPATRVATGDEGGSKVPPRSVVATGPHGWLS